MAEGASGLSTEDIEWCIDAWEVRDTGDGKVVRARAELAALQAAAQANAIQYGQLLYQRERSADLAAALVELRESAVQLGAAQEPLDFALERTALARWRAALTTCYRLAVGADAGPGAAGARAEAALLDAAARYQDAWRVLAAGDTTDEAKRAHILDMHEAREDLFDATEIALRAGGAGEAAGEGERS